MAQQSVQKKKKRYIPDPQSKIMRGFTNTLATRNFDEADVEANRQGLLSDGQIKTLRKDQVKATIWAYFIAAMVALLIIVLCLMAISKIADGPTAIAFFLMIGAICFTFASGAVRSFWQTMNAVIDDGHVQSATGQIALDINETTTNYGTYMRYKLTVAGHAFKIAKDTLLQLKNGEVYTVYFTPHLRTFLSAEPADAAAQYVKKTKHGGKIALGDDGELIPKD